MFELIIHGRDGVLASLPYDPVAGVFGREGQMPELPETLKAWRAEVQEHQPDVVAMRIFTGHECNMRCAYCYQEEERESSKPVRPVDIHKLCDGIVYAYRQRRTADDEGMALSFIGGEPLLYWERIREVILDLEVRIPNFRADIVTNGTLFTGEIAKFCLEHNVVIALSHDGPGQHLRGRDPLEVGTESARALRWFVRKAADKFCVSCTLTHGNLSAKAVRKWLQKRLNVDHIVIADAPACRGQKAGVLDLYSLRDSDMNAFFMGILDICMTEPSFYYRSYQRMMLGFLRVVCDHLPYPERGPCLARFKDAYAVNWEGTMLRCHGQTPDSKFHCGAENRVGDLLEWYDKSMSLAETRAEMARGAVPATLEVPACKACPMLPACHGACPMLDDEAWSNHCQARYTQALAVFTALLKTLWPDMMSFEMKAV